MAWRVSPLVRWTMPPLIVVTTALFIVAHCVVIDTEMIDIKLRGAAEGAGDTTVLHLNVWDFQLKNTVRMMWDSGAWPLAILVVSMSVAWVYAKMIMMMVVWFAPLSRAAAGRLLLLLDLLGKWSFIDLFVALLYQDGLSLQLRRVMQVGDASIGLHSRGGAYVFLSALVVAIAITQVEVAIHRQSSGGEESATTARRDPSVEGRGAATALLSFADAPAADSLFGGIVPSGVLCESETQASQPVDLSDFGSGSAAKQRDATATATTAAALARCAAMALRHIALPLAVVAAAAWTLYAALQPIFAFHYGGVFARYVAPTERVKTRSLVSLLVGLANADFVDVWDGYKKDNLVWGIIGVAIFVSLIAQLLLAPMLIAVLWCPAEKQVVAARCGWCRAARSDLNGDVGGSVHAGGVWGEPPFLVNVANANANARSFRPQEVALRGAQLISAWSATDVFCLSIGVACAEMNTIATYTLTQQPGEVVQLMTDFCGSVAQCLSVNTFLLSGFWQLLGATVLTQVLSATIIVTARRQIKAQRALEAKTSGSLES